MVNKELDNIIYIYENKYGMLPPENEYTVEELIKKSFEAEFGNEYTLFDMITFAEDIARETSLSKKNIIKIIS